MHLLWNILLAFVWCLLYGRLTLPTLSMGLVIGFLILRVSMGPGVAQAYLAFPLRLLAFLIYFGKEMVLAQFRVAYDIVVPFPRSSPGIVAIPLEARTDAEIALLSCFISLTPGTLILALSPDRRLLYVHVMFVPGGDPAKVRQDIKENLERRLLELMR